MNDYLSRVAILLGNENVEKLKQARVLLFGVGGVGSWCAECLVRSGIGHITIVDNDVVVPSNINRQLPATTATVGRAKVEVLKERLAEISPDAEINAVYKRFTAETASKFNLNDYDFIIDAIDSVADKALLIELATRSTARLFSSMGAALKMNPSRIQVAEFYKVKGCPLARALRQRFKRTKIFPAKKFKCVFSDELLTNRQPDPTDSGNGSMMHITAIFGLTLASMVISDITGF